MQKTARSVPPSVLSPIRPAVGLPRRAVGERDSNLNGVAVAACSESHRTKERRRSSLVIGDRSPWQAPGTEPHAGSKVALHKRLRRQWVETDVGEGGLRWGVIQRDGEGNGPTKTRRERSGKNNQHDPTHSHPLSLRAPVVVRPPGGCASDAQ